MQFMISQINSSIMVCLRGPWLKDWWGHLHWQISHRLFLQTFTNADAGMPIFLRC